MAPLAMPLRVRSTKRCTSEPQVGVAQLRRRRRASRVVVGDDPAEAQHDAAVGDRQRAAWRSARRAGRSGRCRSRRSRSSAHDLRGDAAARARARARRAAAAAGAPSARGRSRASGARRRTACWPAALRALGEPREQLVDLGQAVAAAPSPRHSPPRRRFSSTVSSAITPRPSGTCAMPEADDPLDGAAGRCRAPSRRMRPARGAHEARERAQQRRLARAVGAQDRGDAALRAPRRRRRRARGPGRRPSRGPQPAASTSTPEVGVEHALVGAHLGRRALGDAPAEVEHDDAVADATSRGPCGARPAAPPCRRAGARISSPSSSHVVAAQAAGRLVEQQQLAARATSARASATRFWTGKGSVAGRRSATSATPSASSASSAAVAQRALVAVRARQPEQRGRQARRAAGARRRP